MDKTLREIIIDKTRIKGSEDYVIGRISGMIVAFTENYDRVGWAHGHTDELAAMRFEATDEQYDKIVKMINSHYPNYIKE